MPATGSPCSSAPGQRRCRASGTPSGRTIRASPRSCSALRQPSAAVSPRSVAISVSWCRRRWGLRAMSRNAPRPWRRSSARRWSRSCARTSPSSLTTPTNWVGRDHPCACWMSSAARRPLGCTSSCRVGSSLPFRSSACAAAARCWTLTQPCSPSASRKSPSYWRPCSTRTPPPSRLRCTTAGWPAAVRLTAEALRAVPADRRAEALDALHRPGGRLFEYVAEEVFGRAAPSIRKLLRRVAPFQRFNVELCNAVGVRTAAESLAALRRAGLFLELRGGEGEWFGLHTLVREFVLGRWPLNEKEREEVHSRAAAWFQAHGYFDEALESLLAVGDTARIAEVLEAQGSALLASGKVEATIRVARRLPRRLRSAAIEQLLGEAHEIRGEWDEALECFERAAGRRKRLAAGLAWRLGLIHHLRGRLDEAFEIYERGRLDGSDSRDAALLLAWKASACWLRGDAAGCRESAEQAFARASAANDAHALAAAHTVLAMLAALTGDRLDNDAHYLRALEYAERAGDVLQAVRVRTNRGSQHLEEGEYEEALAELEIATRLGDLTGFTFFRALALTNRGEARFRLGRLEEATSDLEASKALYQRAGSRMVCYPLALLGDLYRERGDLALARVFYEEALARAEESGDVQGLVPALAGLAQVLAFENPQRARMLAARAVSCGEGMAKVAAQLAAGWVALAAGKQEIAAASADEAATAARLRRDRAGLAHALELAALASHDRDRQAVLLEEAVSLWRAIRNPLGEARAELILGLTRGAAGAARAAQAEKRLRALGARVAPDIHLGCP